MGGGGAGRIGCQALFSLAVYHDSATAVVLKLKLSREVPLRALPTTDSTHSHLKSRRSRCFSYRAANHAVQNCK